MKQFAKEKIKLYQFWMALDLIYLFRRMEFRIENQVIFSLFLECLEKVHPTESIENIYVWHKKAYFITFKFYNLMLCNFLYFVSNDLELYLLYTFRTIYKT